MITSERKKKLLICVFLHIDIFLILKKMLKKYAVNDLELRTTYGCYRNVR